MNLNLENATVTGNHKKYLIQITISVFTIAYELQDYNHPCTLSINLPTAPRTVVGNSRFLNEYLVHE